MIEFKGEKWVPAAGMGPLEVSNFGRVRRKNEEGEYVTVKPKINPHHQQFIVAWTSDKKKITVPLALVVLRSFGCVD